MCNVCSRFLNINQYIPFVFLFQIRQRVGALWEEFTISSILKLILSRQIWGIRRHILQSKIEKYEGTFERRQLLKENSRMLMLYVFLLLRTILKPFTLRKLQNFLCALKNDKEKYLLNQSHYTDWKYPIIYETGIFRAMFMRMWCNMDFKARTSSILCSKNETF